MILTKNNYLKVLTTLGLAIVVSSSTGCKKPDSNFILHKFDYSAGDMLLVENLSKNDKQTNWEIVSPDEEILQTSDDVNPSFILGIMDPDGYYTLRLTSYSRKEKHRSVEEKPFMIKSLRTYLTVNQNGNGDHDDYSVYIDNQLIGKSNYNGTFQAKIPLGIRIVKLVAETDVKTETIVFNENDSEYISF